MAVFDLKNIFLKILRSQLAFKFFSDFFWVKWLKNIFQIFLKNFLLKKKIFKGFYI